MIKFLIGLMIGGTVGFFTACLMETSREEERDDG